MDADWKPHHGRFMRQSPHAPVAQLVEPIALSACLEWQAEQAVRRRHGCRLETAPRTVHATIPDTRP